MDAITVCENLIHSTCNLQARLRACGDVVTKWKCSISSGYSSDLHFLVQFQRPRLDPAGIGIAYVPDYTADAKELARTLCDAMERDGSSWEGCMRGLPGVKIVIHDAEPQHPRSALVQL